MILTVEQQVAGILAVFYIGLLGLGVAKLWLKKKGY